MDLKSANDSVMRRIKAMGERETMLKENDLYFYNQPIEEVEGGAKAVVHGREMGMYASYSYLGLVGHPRINAAAKAAVDKFGTGTNGVRTLAGTLTIHTELEETIANFKHAEAAITYSSGYATNLTVISTLMGRGDYVLSDKLNHASIVDGCLMSGAEFRRFRHNDMAAPRAPSQARAGGRLPNWSSRTRSSAWTATSSTCRKWWSCARKYNAWLMIDEAHSVGVLGKTGTRHRGTFRSRRCDRHQDGHAEQDHPLGGRVRGRESKEIINYLRHASRAYIFSAALPPAQAAAANEAFKVILDEPWRIEKLNENTRTVHRRIERHGLRHHADRDRHRPGVVRHGREGVRHDPRMPAQRCLCPACRLSRRAGGIGAPARHRHRRA